MSEIQPDVWTPQRFAELIISAAENPHGFALIRHVTIEEAKMIFPDEAKSTEPSHVLDSERQER